MNVGTLNGLSKEQEHDATAAAGADFGLSRSRSGAAIQHRGATPSSTGGSRATPRLLVPGPRRIQVPNASLIPDYATFYPGVVAAREAIGYTSQVIRNWLMSTGTHFLLGKADAGKSQLLSLIHI